MVLLAAGLLANRVADFGIGLLERDGGEHRVILDDERRCEIRWLVDVADHARIANGNL